MKLKWIGPSTPKKKRETRILPPVTPTPSAIGLMTAPYNASNTVSNHLINRLVVPNGTNAPLVTPETHRLIANKPVDQVSPSKVSSIRTTTTNVLDEALAHLIKIEPKLKPIIEKHPCRVFSPEGLAEEIDPFNSLTSGIISQQVGLPDYQIKSSDCTNTLFRCQEQLPRASKPSSWLCSIQINQM